MTNIKVVTKKGLEEGPTTVILAGVHGDETCNVEAFDELIPTITIDQGTVHFIYANLQAIKENKRYIEENLNRTIGKESNSIEGRTAKELEPYLETCDYLLDMHATKNYASQPFTISFEETLEQYLPATINVKGFEEHLQGTTCEYATTKGAKTIAYEAGKAKEQESKERAKKALQNFLKATNNKKEKPETYNNKTHYHITGKHENNKEFTLTKKFKDFETLTKTTIIGHEETTPITEQEGTTILFAENNNKTKQECYYKAKKQA